MAAALRAISLKGLALEPLRPAPEPALDVPLQAVDPVRAFSGWAPFDAPQLLPESWRRLATEQSPFSAGLDVALVPCLRARRNASFRAMLALLRHDGLPAPMATPVHGGTPVAGGLQPDQWFEISYRRPLSQAQRDRVVARAVEHDLQGALLVRERRRVRGGMRYRNHRLWTVVDAQAVEALRLVPARLR